MAIADRRDDMSLGELLDELELARPELLARFEADHPAAMHAVAENPDGQADEDFDADPQDLDDLRDDLRALLRI